MSQPKTGGTQREGVDSQLKLLGLILESVGSLRRFKNRKGTRSAVGGRKSL